MTERRWRGLRGAARGSPLPLARRSRGGRVARGAGDPDRPPL